MRYTFLHTPLFTARWRALGLEDDDLRDLERELLRSALANPVMRSTGGVRKMRFAPRSWGGGKSGGTRICYVCFVAYETILLVTAFRKNDQANLTAAQRAAVQCLVTEVAAELEHSHEAKKRR